MLENGKLLHSKCRCHFGRPVSGKTGAVKFFLLILLLWLVSGCGGMTGTGKILGLGNSDSHAANQTIFYPLNLVDAATLQALDKMEIMIIDDDNSISRKTISAATVHLDILIELEPLNQESTRMRVGVKHAASEQDKSTAQEIIEETEKFLIEKRSF